MIFKQLQEPTESDRRKKWQFIDWSQPILMKHKCSKFHQKNSDWTRQSSMDNASRTQGSSTKPRNKCQKKKLKYCWKKVCLDFWRIKRMKNSFSIKQSKISFRKMLEKLSLLEIRLQPIQRQNSFLNKDRMTYQSMLQIFGNVLLKTCKLLWIKCAKRQTIWRNTKPLKNNKNSWSKLTIWFTSLSGTKQSEQVLTTKMNDSSSNSYRKSQAKEGSWESTETLQTLCFRKFKSLPEDSE